MRWLARRTPPLAPKGRHAAGRTTPPRVTPAFVSAVPSVPPPVSAQLPVRAGSGVHLGFADGSRHELAPDDPRVTAFRAVARTLVGV